MTTHINILKNYFRDYQVHKDFVNKQYNIEKELINEKYVGVSSYDYSSIKNQPNYYNNDRLNEYSDELEILNIKYNNAREYITLVNDLIEDVFNTSNEDNYELYDIFNLRFRHGMSVSQIAEILEYDDYQEQNIYKKINVGFSKISQTLIKSAYPLRAYKKDIDKLKHIRKYFLILTQKQAAKKFNISREHYNRMEKGTQDLSEDIIKLIRNLEKDEENEYITFLYNIQNK